MKIQMKRPLFTYWPGMSRIDGHSPTAPPRLRAPPQPRASLAPATYATMTAAGSAGRPARAAAAEARPSRGIAAGPTALRQAEITVAAG